MKNKSKIPLFNNYISDNYKDLLDRTIQYTKGNIELSYDILHYTIDYLYHKGNMKKINRLIIEGDIDKYMRKVLYLNITSEKAPYQQEMRKHQLHFGYYSDSDDLGIYLNSICDQELLNKEYYDDSRYNLINKLIYTDLVKEQFGSEEQWEYARKIFLSHLEDGIGLNEYSKITGIHINTVGYNFRKMKEILTGIIGNRELCYSIEPNLTKQIYSKK